MRYKRVTYIILIVSILFNLGRFLDVTDDVKHVDILVYLGGGFKERIEKTLELYKKGYSRSSKIIFTGQKNYRVSKKNCLLESKKKFFINNKIEEKNLIYKKLGNTSEEVKYVKSYMELNDFKSVIFITDPPHARRVKILANTFSNYPDSNISAYVIGSDVKWWSKNKFFMNKEASIFVFSESVKIIYNYIVYGLLEPLGWLPYIKENYGKSIRKFIESIKVFVFKL